MKKGRNWLGTQAHVLDAAQSKSEDKLGLSRPFLSPLLVLLDRGVKHSKKLLREDMSLAICISCRRMHKPGEVFACFLREFWLDLSEIQE